jgi:hypothetical protein
LLFSISSAFAEEHQTAKDVQEFLKPFVGFWENTGESEGEVVKGVWTVKPSTIAPCFLTYGSNTANGPFQTLDCYDSVAQKWTVASFGSGGAFRLTRYGVRAESGKHYGKGVSTPTESTTLESDGTKTIRNSIMTCLEYNDQGMVLKFSGGTENGESKPDSKLTMKRQEEQPRMQESPDTDVADAQQEAAQNYIDFFKPFVGDWKTKLESEGEVVEGKWSGRLSPTRLCYISRGTAAEQPSSQGIHGYDAGTKKWTVAAFNSDGEFSIARLDFGEIGKGDRFKRGTSGDSVKVISHNDGTTTEVTCKFVCKECSKNEIVYIQFDRKENGESKPDQTFRMER